jgi:hypothetical protein
MGCHTVNWETLSLWDRRLKNFFDPEQETLQE